VTDERLQREQEFHDHAFADDRRLVLDKYYAVNRAAEEAYVRALTALVSGGGKDVLEYGCGQGSAAFDLAAAGNRVLGIDISPVAIDQATAQAAERGLQDLATFRVMNAEELDLPSSSYDVVCGSGILHHLDVARSGREIARVLRQDGAAVYIEPLGHNPAINLYRRLTPSMRTVDEHPLKVEDFAVLRESFADVSLTYYSLATLLAVPFRSRPWFARLVTRLERVDRRLLSGGRLAKQGWCAVVTLRGARAAAATAPPVSG
jgi:SAM-dependent methyltransferase